jgi:hypothetical protein
LSLIWEVVRVLLPFGLSLYALIKSINRDDAKQRKEKDSRADERFHKLELSVLELDNLRKGHQQQFERACDDFMRRHQEHENKLGQVGQLREDMASVKAKLESYGHSIDEIKGMVYQLLQRN